MAVLALLFLVVPIAELAIIIRVGSALGVWTTIALLIAVSVAGAWLVRWQGLATLRKVQAELYAGRMPARQLVDGALILFAGALMLTPGFLTDAVGLLLLLPPTRSMARGAVVRRFSGRIHTFGPTGAAGGPGRGPRPPSSPGGGDGVIDV